MSLINREKLMAEFSGDEEILNEIIVVFFDEAPKMMQKLNEAVQSGDAKQIEHHAHTIKGAVSNFQAQTVKDTAFKLEIAGRESKLENSKLDFSNLNMLIEQMVYELKDLISVIKGA